ncbi:hypothetical protein Tco_0063102, partial [Tanacetum coccineum]
MHRDFVSKQGRKFAKGKPSVHKDPLFDEIPEDTLDYIETEDAQDVGRTRDVVDEEKENDENVLSTEDVLSTAQQIVSTDGSKVSTVRQKYSTDEQNKGTDEQSKGTDDHNEEGSATQTTQPPTSTIFRDDETIAQVLLNMSQAKAVSREKEKGVEFKDIKETNRPRPTSTRSLLTLKPLPKIDPKDKGKKKIEEGDKSKSESDGIPEAEKKFKALVTYLIFFRKIFECRPTKNQLRNQMMTYLKHVGNFKHSDLKTKKFEEVQALYEKIKRSDEDFISIGSAEDERLIKKMNEMVKEESKEEESTRKRKLGTRKKMKSRKRRF